MKTKTIISIIFFVIFEIIGFIFIIFTPFWYYGFPFIALGIISILVFHTPEIFQWIFGGSKISKEKKRKCSNCGREIPWNAKKCSYCGHDFLV